MYIAIVGLIMLIVFMTLILTKRTSVFTALIIVPIVFGFIAGFGKDTLSFAAKGIIDVGPTVATLAFAILFFGILLSAGLFDPLGGIVLRFMKGDPFRVILGTAILSSLVSFDGDAVTTIMICCAVLLPVYNKLKINRAYLAIFVIMPNGIINMFPWGGPTVRLMSVAQLDSGELLSRLLPLIVVGILVTLLLAAFVGMKERKRLGIADFDLQAAKVELDANELELRRPKKIWFNLILAILVLVAIIALKIPGILAFAIGSAIALIVNYSNLKAERKVIEKISEGIISVVLVILGAGVLMGILNESGMAAAMAEKLIAIIPASWASKFNLIFAVIGGPAVWILNNDAFYFGVYPVLAKTAMSYGYSAMQVGLASIMGQALRGFSPVIPALYFLASYVGVEFSEYQKKAIPISLVLFAAYIATGFFMNIYFLN